MIKEIKGNLLTLSKEGRFDMIGHGCNTQKNMGGGIALSLKNMYPKAYEVDKATNAVMGEYSICRDYEECIILNIYSQYYPGGKNNFGIDSKENRYLALNKAFKSINKEFKGKHIGLPLIGAGLAGLEWNKVKEIIGNNLTDMDVTIVHFE